MAFNQLNALDFNDIKAGIKDYLKSSNIFTDYDFEGSVLSNVIDVLAYNTYYTSFNANLAINEVFLDSAIVRENVIRIAKLLNYTPRSALSSKANVRLTVTGNTSDTVTLKAGVVFTSNNDNGSFVFSLPNDITVPVNRGDNTATFSNVEIYEGNLVENTFIVSTNSKFIIPSPNIDITTLRVEVFDSPQSDESVIYKKTQDLIGVTPESNIYFVQETSSQQYEIIFGDGIFGRKLENNNVVRIRYISCSGELANGCLDFRNGFVGTILDSFGNLVSTGISITNLNSSFGGGGQEPTDSIKYYAPRFFQSQGRAVTTKDYEAIIPTIYPNIDSISVYGGEEDLPPQFGVVNLVIKPKTGDKLSFSEKNKITNLLKQYSVASVTPKIKDPSVIYIEINTAVYYNTLLTNKNADGIRLSVIQAIIGLNTTKDFNKFGGKFRYTRFTSLIDNAEPSITSNITKIRLRKNLDVALNVETSYKTCFANRIKSGQGVSITSSGFKIFGQDARFFYYFEDDGSGNLLIWFINEFGEKKYLANRKSFGTVDYLTGEVAIFPINIIQTEKQNNQIYIYVAPSSNDIVSIRDVYLTIDTENLQISVNEDIIASGQTNSGLGVIPVSS